MSPTCCGYLVRSHGDPMDKWNTPEVLTQEFIGTSGVVNWGRRVASPRS